MGLTLEQLAGTVALELVDEALGGDFFVVALRRSVHGRERRRDGGRRDGCVVLGVLHHVRWLGGVRRLQGFG